jgi:hypothetical protein
MDRFWKHVAQRRLCRIRWATTLQAVFLVSIAFAFSSCGGNSSSGGAPGTAQVAGNWQFAMSATGTSYASSPLQGGFLVEKNGALSGQTAFSIVLPSTNGGSTVTCNAGTATVTGTVSGQTVNLTLAIATLDQNGNPTTQTITLTGGQLGTDGAGNSTIGGTNATYSFATTGYANINSQLTPCGSSSDTGTWSAASVPPLTGGFQGFFHSTTGTVVNQDFSVSGTFSQGPNIGASSATVTGTLIFQDPVTLLPNYPCLTTASVNGTISGNTVLLQIFSGNGTDVGQIGQAPGQSSGISLVTYDSTQGGYVLHNAKGPGGGYSLTTKSCSLGDSGNLCFAIGSANACKQPITLTPSNLTFPPQLLGSTGSSQTITLTNNSSSQLTGLSIALNGVDSRIFYTTGGDFNGVANFSEQDTCTQQGTISLNPGSSCTVTVSFTPQESCPWLPQQISGNASVKGYPPALCPLPLTTSLVVTLPAGSADADNKFVVPITGTGLSAVVPSVAELDFGAQAIGEASPPQTLTFTNQSPKAVTIAPSAQPCIFIKSLVGQEQSRPPFAADGTAVTNGLSLAETAFVGFPQYSGAISFPNPFFLVPPLINAPTVQYWCETDPPLTMGGTGNPNFLISDDNCSGQTLQPFGQVGNSCSLQVTFVPQLETWLGAVSQATGLDDFLQLNSAWCGDANNPPEANCEIDSGRFPVEIKTNQPSPLRMTPGAALEFGTVLKGTGSATLTLTLFNDPVDPKSAAVTFVSKVVTGSDYLESDSCPTPLAPNQSCTITVTFAPSITGSDLGQITLTYNTPTQFGQVQTIYLRGIGQ